jgi:two-component system sensor histidine kinase TctE
LRRHTVDLAQVVRDVVRDFVPRAMERRIDLGYEGPDGPDVSAATCVWGEPVLLGVAREPVTGSGAAPA